MNRTGPQTIADVLRTVYFIIKKKSERTHICLAISPSPAFQFDALCCDHFVRPGLWRQRATASQLKHAALALRKLGYYIDLYTHKELAQWYEAFNAIPVVESDGHLGDRNKITKTLPNCQTYVELFGAGESLLAARQPASVEVYNDFSGHAVNFFRVLREPAAFSSFFMLSRLFPARAPLDRLALRTYLQLAVEPDPVLRAYAWYCNLLPDHPTYTLVNPPTESEEEQVAAMLNAVDPSFSWVRHRLVRVQYEYNSWQKVLDLYDSQGSLFWVDVPSRGPEALSPDGTQLLVSSLNHASGAVALYIDHSDQNELVAKLLRSEARRKGSRWRSTKYKTCTVFRKPNR